MPSRKLLAAGLLAALLGIALKPGAAFKPGEVRAYATIYSIGIEWDIAGDPDHDATAQVEYRVQSSNTWSRAMPLVRVDYNGRNMLAGSILFLSPNTTFQVKLTLTDPAGGTETRTTTAKTRPIPALPTGGRTFHVVPGSGWGDGSVGKPFKGIGAAEAAAQRSDIFLLHAGNYGGRIAFKKGGTSTNNYIVWKAAGDGEATFYGIDVKASYLWLEGLTIRDQSSDYANGLHAVGPTNVVVTRNYFYNNSYNIHLTGGSRDWYIADNRIHGSTDPASQSFTGEGIEMANTGGHTIAHNDITWVADGMSAPGPNTDILGNDIHDTADDGIEGDTDIPNPNVRMWRNRIHNVGHNAISFQPQLGVPWYIVRNQIVGYREGVFKFRYKTDRAVVLHNTIVSWNSIFNCCNDDWLLRMIVRNNLWVSATNGKMWGFDSATKSWETDIDYNGFDWGGHSTPFSYGGSSYSTVSSFSAASRLETHGRQVNKSTCFETFAVPGPPPTPIPPQYMTLKAGCNAIDAGAILPNVNNGFLGAAPDLGAYEYGQPLPHYGPRPLEPMTPPAPPTNVRGVR
jgi:hypothetical protein